MTNRREFLRTGATISALPMMGGSAMAGPTPPATLRPHDLHCFVFDGGFADARAVAAHADHGAPLHPIDGDVTALWYDVLDKPLKDGPLALAGVTTADALFVLERLGWDRGLRVTYRGVHGIPKDGQVAHELTGPAGLIHASLQDAAAPWTAMAGRMASHALVGPATPASLNLTTADTSPGGRDRILYSWSMEPRRSA